MIPPAALPDALSAALDAIPGWLWPVAGGVLGVIFGSWIATAALRWPEGRSTARGRSACDVCTAPLGVRDLVPVVSFVARRGRCRRCGGLIDPLHPGVELAGAAIGAICLGVAPGGGGLAGAGFGLALLLLALLDTRHFWLPDRVTLPLLATGLIAGLLGLAPSLVDRCWGAAIGWAGLATVRHGYRRLRGREGMGAADPKLFAAIGAWLGWVALPPTLLIASLIGLAAALAQAARGRPVTGATPLPFGALLAAAAMIVWVAGQVVARS